MKSQYYPLAVKLKYFIALIITLFILNRANAQSVTLTSNPSTWNLSNVSGNLIIRGDGITDLSKMGDNSPTNLISVTGNLLIDNCPNLATLDGLQHLASVGGYVLIRNNDQLSNIEHLQSLGSIGGYLLTDNCDNLFSLDGLDNLTSIGGYVLIRNHNQLSNLQGLQSLVSIDGYLNINNCDNLTSLDGLENVSVINGDLTVINNNSLQACCSILPIIDIASSVSISNNATGCESLAVVNAPPIVAPCPPNQTVSADLGTCAKEVVLIDPLISDNCDLVSSSYTVDITRLDNFNSIPGSPGATLTFDYPVGVSTVEWYVNDANGQVTTCTTIITVEDNEAPQWTETVLTKLVEIECGETTVAATLLANTPSATDFCSTAGVSISDTNAGTTACGLDEIEYEFTATDMSGNTNPQVYQLTIREVDNTPPTLTGLPVNVTISCNDAYPDFPSMTAIDGCDGDISGNISITGVPSVGSCGEGEIAEVINYIISVEDACGNETSAPYSITVVSDFTFELGEDINVCGETFYILNPGNLGTAYEWSNGSNAQVITVVNSGTYTLTVTSNNGCCYSDQITVNLGEAPESEATGGVISCATGSAQISSSSNIANSTFSWTGPGGFTSTDQNPNVTDAGEYTVMVTSPVGCTSSATATVTGGSDLPDASATGGTVSCSETMAEISGASETAGVSFAWTGPDNFSSSDQNATVDAPGIYTLIVTASNGCTATASAEVIDNQNSPVISVTGTDVNCGSPISTLSIDSDLELVEYAWTGPDGFVSTNMDPELMAAGTYELEATADNGCTATASVLISEDFSIPNLTIMGGTISCTANSIMISATSSTDGATFLWSGPDDFTSTLANPSVTQPGTYLVQVMGPNGCTLSGPAEVVSDSDLPNISATGGSINCINENVTIVGSTTTDGATFSWSGPNGFISTEAENTVTTEGTYTFTVIAASGCEAFKDVEVFVDTEDPEISLFQGNLDCENGTREFSLTTNTTDATFEWSGPDGFTSSEQNPSYSLAGMYTVKVTGNNGCVTEASVQVADDIALTFQIVINGTSAEATVSGGTGPFTFVWDGNTGESTIQDLEVGSHELKIIDGLGCINTNTFEIGTSGIEDLERSAFVKIYPNPTSAFLTLELDDINISDSQVVIYDINGNEMKSMGKNAIKIGKNRIETSDLSSGFYLISVRTEEKIISKKFLKI